MLRHCGGIGCEAAGYHTIGAKQLRTATPFLMSQQVDGTSLLMVKLKLIGMLQITLLKSVTVYNFFCVDALARRGALPNGVLV